MSAPTPPLVIEAFGKNAVDPDFINTIPVSTADPQRASLNLGFPPDTMKPVVAGGKPPRGQDMNGILFMLSSHTVYQQTGQPYAYDLTLATALGGYAIGTVLGMSDGSGTWINRVAANVTDPDAGGAGWSPIYSYGIASVPGLTGGVATLTTAQAKKKIISLSGTLVSNLQVIVPDRVQDWLIVNSTTGLFTTTVKTASGSGVEIPQGGFASPTGVYSDATNVYLTVSPAALPIDQGPNPLTIVQRTNQSWVLATYFNSAIVQENILPSSVYYESDDDNFIRKMDFTDFEGRITISHLFGQLDDAQVPASAVNQWALGGTGAAWANVTGSRAVNTLYTNSTGLPIMVALSMGLLRASAGGGTLTVNVDGVALPSFSAPGSTDGQQGFSFIVPPGSTYQVVQSGGINSIAWMELS